MNSACIDTLKGIAVGGQGSGLGAALSGQALPVSMVIEFFGPPGSGKTTLAKAFAAKLRESGRSVVDIASERPSERQSDSAAPTLLRIVKLQDALNTGQDHTGTRLIQLMPPKWPLRKLRLRRYLSRLGKALQSIESSRGVAIVDQGYLNALCSLAGELDVVPDELLARCLDLIPRPVLVVRMHAPESLVCSRLSNRLAKLGIVERFFEPNVKTSLRQNQIATKLDVLLRERNWPVVDVGQAGNWVPELAAESLLQTMRYTSCNVHS
jgi:energy-coupling factor transporter ATP-binding protein EcfA2